MRAILLTLVSLATAPLLAQAPPAPSSATSIGSVAVADATLSGTLTLADGRALIGSSAVITARDRTATIHLSRGGDVLVCSTSVLHAARSDAAAAPAPLLLALDHGAFEVHMASSPHDAILTPDLRLTVVSPAEANAPAPTFDLRLRVTSNGDTCVDNHGDQAPTLEVSEQFGSGLFRIRPGQHLLFEHGSLREVVDNESSPCGCPVTPTVSVAAAGTSTDATHAARPGQDVAPAPPAEDPHPFPAAESQGLTPAESAGSTVPQADPTQPHAQVAATLAYTPQGSFDGTSASPNPTPPVPTPAPTQPTPAEGQPTSATPPPAAATPAPSPAPAPAPAPLVAQAPPPPPAPSAHTVFQRIGHFFAHLLD